MKLGGGRDATRQPEQRRRRVVDLSSTGGQKPCVNRKLGGSTIRHRPRCQTRLFCTRSAICGGPRPNVGASRSPDRTWTARSPAFVPPSSLSARVSEFERYSIPNSLAKSVIKLPTAMRVHNTNSAGVRVPQRSCPLRAPFGPYSATRYPSARGLSSPQPSPRERPRAGRGGDTVRISGAPDPPSPLRNMGLGTPVTVTGISL
jgi:hypothetical protein